MKGDKVRFTDEIAERGLPNWIKHGILPEWIKGLDGEIIDDVDTFVVQVKFTKGNKESIATFYRSSFGI